MKAVRAWFWGVVLGGEKKKRFAGKLKQMTSSDSQKQRLNMDLKKENPRRSTFLLSWWRALVSDTTHEQNADGQRQYFQILQSMKILYPGCIVSSAPPSPLSLKWGLKLNLSAVFRTSPRFPISGPSLLPVLSFCRPLLLPFQTFSSLPSLSSLIPLSHSFSLILNSAPVERQRG